jgi:hypothetical protein
VVVIAIALLPSRVNHGVSIFLGVGNDRRRRCSARCDRHDPAFADADAHARTRAVAHPDSNGYTDSYGYTAPDPYDYTAPDPYDYTAPYTDPYSGGGGYSAPYAPGGINSAGCPKNRWVNGYMRSDGTYVQGYWRNSPVDGCDSSP